MGVGRKGRHHEELPHLFNLAIDFHDLFFVEVGTFKEAVALFDDGVIIEQLFFEGFVSNVFVLVEVQFEEELQEGIFHLVELVDVVARKTDQSSDVFDDGLAPVGNFAQLLVFTLKVLCILGLLDGIIFDEVDLVGCHFPHKKGLLKISGQNGIGLPDERDQVLLLLCKSSDFFLDDLVGQPQQHLENIGHLGDQVELLHLH